MNVITAIQPELTTIVVAIVVAIAGYLYQWGLQRLPASAHRIIAQLAVTATQAVEQKYQQGQPGGALKKQEAMHGLAAMCQELGLAFHEHNASAAIESAVYTMNLYHHKPGTAPASTPLASPDTATAPIIPALLTLPSKTSAPGSETDAAR